MHVPVLLQMIRLKTRKTGITVFKFSFSWKQRQKHFSQIYFKTLQAVKGLTGGLNENNSFFAL